MRRFFFGGGRRRRLHFIENGAEGAVLSGGDGCKTGKDQSCDRLRAQYSGCDRSLRCITISTVTVIKTWSLVVMVQDDLKAPSANIVMIYLKNLFIFHAFLNVKSGLRNCRQTTGKIESKYFSGHLFFYRSKKFEKRSDLGAMGSEHLHGIPCIYKGIPL